ncbi:MAG: BadF/BadG/BcrA/BcrD ATPase family protein [Propionicimonas sp.]|nr:BadF/BadG/BcrA/BcrD ATPase family protein [Propionicimonas sp.]
MVDVDHDCRIALAGGLAGRPGMVLIAGTGASCFGRTRDGREWRSSGWGTLFGDEDSAYWIALQAIRAVLRGEDGRGSPTGLRTVLFAALDVDTAGELLSGAAQGRWDRAALAALAPLVIQAAEAGDSAACAVVAHAVEELSGSVGDVASALRLDSSPFGVALVGGLFQSAAVRDLLRSQLLTTMPSVSVVQPQLPPVLGAVLLALARKEEVPAEVIGLGVPRAAFRDRSWLLKG